MINDDALVIYTDGSSKKNPRRGGIGYVFVYAADDGEPVVEKFCPPGYKEGTSGLMELVACLEAIKEARSHPRYDLFSDIVLFTDSQYVKNNQYRPYKEWPANDWKGSDGRPIRFVEFWKKLRRERNAHSLRVDIRWVKAHSKSKYNKLADKLAGESADNATNPPLVISSTRRKTSRKETKPGSIEMRGQRISLRIVSCTPLQTQKMWLYRCEVISKRSKYFGCVQEIHSSEYVRDGHHYEVTLNTNDKNPTILKILRELDR